MSRIVASYLLRVTLRERQPNPASPPLEVPEPPTNDEVASLTKQALYDVLPYFGDDEIRVSSERLDV
jgi:hypothetical protein